MNRLLEEQLTLLLRTANEKYFNRDESLNDLSNLISSEMGSFYLTQSAAISVKDNRIFSFNFSEEKHIGYLLWSEDLNLAKADASRFFVLLTGFGFISGAEIVEAKERKYKFWSDLLGEKSLEMIIENLEKIGEQTAFAGQSILVAQYLTILKKISETAWSKLSR